MLLQKLEKLEKENNGLTINFENQRPFNIKEMQRFFMSEDIESEKIKAEREEMKEEAHNLELKENYEQDEEYEESED